MSSNDINEKDNFINDFILNEKKLETVKMTDRSMQVESMLSSQGYLYLNNHMHENTVQINSKGPLLNREDKNFKLLLSENQSKDFKLYKATA